MTLKGYNIDKSWALFLDRDGVINCKIPDAYVLDWKQFGFIPGSIEALKICASVFGRIIVVTNQQGVGKGLMTEKKLNEVHKEMIAEIESNKGKIDRIFYATQLAESNHIERKPNVGMGLKAKREFPEIDFRKTIMAGDSKSDMEFGHKLGMVNVLINHDKSLAARFPQLINFIFDDLLSFANQLKIKT